MGAPFAAPSTVLDIEPEFANKADVEVATVELDARNVEAWEIEEKCELAWLCPWEDIVPWKLFRRGGSCEGAGG